MGPEQVTADWIAEVLGGDVASVQKDRIGDGLVGLNLRVTLADADPSLPRSVVVKLPSLDAVSRATGVALRNYEREVKFYTEVAGTVAIRVPHCYHGDWDPATHDFVLVLEDMAPAEPGDQIAGCDVGRAADALAALAGLHGPRWNDATLDDVDWLARRTPASGEELAALWQMLYPGFIATYRKYLSDEATELVEWFGAHVQGWAQHDAGSYAVTHGDFRLDNLLFGTSAGGPPVTAVDWQTPGHGGPVADASYFCGAGLLPHERRAHERELLAIYQEALDGFGVTVEDDWLWEEYRRTTFAGVVMAVAASQIVGSSERSEQMFAVMATRHLQHAVDLDARELVE